MIEQGIAAKAAAAASLDEIAALLQSFPRIGDFKAGQFALDLNYGPHLRLPVGNFVVAGPGARSIRPPAISLNHAKRSLKDRALQPKSRHKVCSVEPPVEQTEEPACATIIQPTHTGPQKAFYCLRL